MPSYLSPRHGVSLSEALAEAAAVAPVQRVVLDTFELYHSIGTPDGPVYVVNDEVALTATKEATADRDAGETVEFMRAPMKFEKAEQSDANSAPEISITIGNVSGVMASALRAARGSLEPWQVIHRVYASDETSGPAVMPPLKLYLVNVDIIEEGVVFRASFGDPSNVSVPALTFKRSEYPGLVR